MALMCEIIRPDMEDGIDQRVNVCGLPVHFSLSLPCSSQRWKPVCHINSIIVASYLHESRVYHGARSFMMTKPIAVEWPTYCIQIP